MSREMYSYISAPRPAIYDSYMPMPTVEQRLDAYTILYIIVRPWEFVKWEML